jgi:predicted nucleic acid-binding protein
MKKQSVYFDTSFFSALHYSGRVLECIHRQAKTQEWWRHERRNSDLRASAVVEEELAAGLYRDQKYACAAVRRLRYLAYKREVDEIADLYVKLKVVPEGKPADAAHLAFAVAYRIDYLMSWNFAHLANPEVQVRLEKENKRLNLRTPKLVTPDSIPQKRFGQEIEQ